MTGLIALIVALVCASAVGAAVRVRAGKVRSSSTGYLTAGDLGASLGERATLVQFSTEFCAYCGPARTLLGELAAERPGVGFVEVDAARRMDLTKRLGVFSTPTVLVLDPDGAIAARSAGRPRKADLVESLRSVMDDGVRS